MATGTIINSQKIETLAVTQTRFARVDICRCGKIVTIAFVNLISLPASGATTVFTLPSGWCPAFEVRLPIPFVDNGTAKPFRVQINADGTVDCHNYSGVAVTGSTNASASITFVAA